MCAWCFAELLYHDREKNYVFYEVAARTPSAEERLARVDGRELTESEMNCLISNFSRVAEGGQRQLYTFTRCSSRSNAWSKRKRRSDWYPLLPLMGLFPTRSMDKEAHGFPVLYILHTNSLLLFYGVATTALPWRHRLLLGLFVIGHNLVLHAPCSSHHGFLLIVSH